MNATIFLTNDKVVSVSKLSEVRIHTSGGAGAKTISIEEINTLEILGNTHYIFVGENSTATFGADTIQYVEFKKV